MFVEQFFICSDPVYGLQVYDTIESVPNHFFGRIRELKAEVFLEEVGRQANRQIQSNVLIQTIISTITQSRAWDPVNVTLYVVKCTINFIMHYWNPALEVIETLFTDSNYCSFASDTTTLDSTSFSTDESGMDTMYDSTTTISSSYASFEEEYEVDKSSKLNQSNKNFDNSEMFENVLNSTAISEDHEGSGIFEDISNLSDLQVTL